MKKLLVGAATVAAAVVLWRRFGSNPERWPIMKLMQRLGFWPAPRKEAKEEEGVLFEPGSSGTVQN
jgi:hypothetical protein